MATPAPKVNKFWNFTEHGNDAELQLFGTISSEEDWWSDDCVTYRNFINDLNALGPKDNINVLIQSQGGDVFAANAFGSRLKTRNAEKKILVSKDKIFFIIDSPCFIEVG